MSGSKLSIRAAEVAFFANKAYFDACERARGCIDQVDFDKYVDLILESVPDTIDFGSASKKFRGGRTRLNEFRKYLFFRMPDGLTGGESKEAESAGLEAVCACLRSYGIECRVSYSFRN